MHDFALRHDRTVDIVNRGIDKIMYVIILLLTIIVYSIFLSICIIIFSIYYALVELSPVPLVVNELEILGLVIERLDGTRTEIWIIS